MPFTFSHPAIVLPVYRLFPRLVSLTGLVAGSVVPDFEYFIRMRVRSTVSHSIYGLFWFDLPLGILLAFIFHNSIRDRLYDNLPVWLKKRVCIYKAFAWNRYFRRHWLAVIISVLAGAMSHLFWDGFTHAHGIFVRHISLLSMNVSLLGYPVQACRVLQHLSTIAGATFIIFFLRSMPVSFESMHRHNPAYWPFVVAITTTVVITRFLFGIDQNVIGQMAGTGISALLIALVLTPLLVRENPEMTG